MLNKLEAIITRNTTLRKFTLWLITPNTHPRPRLWVKWFVNPFIHTKGKGACIRRRRSRIDVFPWHQFSIGKNSIIEDFTTINNGAGDVIIGDQVIVGIGSVIIGPVNIGNNVGFGQHTFIAGFNHGYEDEEQNFKEQPLIKKEVVIGQDSHIGANSVIVAGVHIGKNA